MRRLACVDVVELLTAYLDGALGALMRRRVARHLVACPGCRTYLDQLEQTIGALRALGRVG